MILEFEKVDIEFRTKVILNGISFKLDAGEFVALLGQNGAGKTTLLRSVIRLIKPASGNIKIDGLELQNISQAQIGRLLSYVPQSLQIVFDVFVDQLFEKLADPITLKLISELNIDEFIDRRFISLSGGEKQRVLLASALARKPKLLLLDELTQFADVATTNFLGEFLKSFCASSGLTILAVSHDMNWVQKFTQRALLIKDTKLIPGCLDSIAAHTREILLDGVSDAT